MLLEPKIKFEVLVCKEGTVSQPRVCYLHCPPCFCCDAGSSRHSRPCNFVPIPLAVTRRGSLPRLNPPGWEIGIHWWSLASSNLRRIACEWVPSLGEHVAEILPRQGTPP